MSKGQVRSNRETKKPKKRSQRSPQPLPRSRTLRLRPRRNSGKSCSCRLQSRQECGGFGCLGCGGEDRLLVGFEDGKPGREILRVIGAGLVGDLKIGAEEDGSEFGDQLLHRIGLVAEAVSELAIAAVLAAGPVAKLMAQRGKVRFRWRARRGANEGLAWRQVDAVRRRTVVGPAAAMMDSCAGRGDESLGLLDRAARRHRAPPGLNQKRSRNRLCLAKSVQPPATASMFHRRRPIYRVRFHQR